ncbi:MAG: hypothetical protein AAF090_13975 [Bacteroidota bacterium]
MKKTIKTDYLNFVRHALTLLLLFTILACSDDEDDAPQITLGQLSSQYEGTCDHSSGVTGADYAVQIPYNGTENDSLARLLITVAVEGGPTDESISNFNDFDLNDGSGTLTWNSCILFLDAEWIDLEFRMETLDGAVSSAASIRLNRTDFDN